MKTIETNARFSNSKLNALSEELKQAINEVIAPFERYRDDQVIRYLWKLTSQPEYAMAKMQFSDEEIEQLLPLSKKIRNEIISRFDKAGLFELPENYDKNLFDALGGDKVAYKVVTNMVDNTVCTAHIESIKEAHRLLNHKNPEKVFGGLRSVGFDKFEANFLMPKDGSLKVAEAIRDYFNGLYDNLPAEMLATASGMANAPENNTICSGNEISIPIPTLHEEVTEGESSVVVDETAVDLMVTVIDHLDEIESLYKSIDMLKDAFDINDLIARRGLYEKIAGAVSRAV